MSLLSTSPYRLLTAAKPQLEKLAARGLGLLVTWQLLFIPLANYLEFFPHRPAGTGELTDYRELGPGSSTNYPLINNAAKVTDAWAQLTGQYQMWWLFAPQFPPASTFPEVQVQTRGEDSQSLVKLQSSFEPPASGEYLRVSPGKDRLFLYEMHLGIGLTWWDASKLSKDPAERADWQKHFRALATRQQQSLTRYALWRSEPYFSQPHTAKRPHQIVLGMNRYPSDLTGTSPALPPHEFIPVLRLNRSFDAQGVAQIDSVEAFDPVSREYWPLKNK